VAAGALVAGRGARVIARGSSRGPRLVRAAEVLAADLLEPAEAIDELAVVLTGRCRSTPIGALFRRWATG